jgi:hypothetical protein
VQECSFQPSEGQAEAAAGGGDQSSKFIGSPAFSGVPAESRY